eukprot:2088652-Rhodomonas_salina.3
MAAVECGRGAKGRLKPLVRAEAQLLRAHSHALCSARLRRRIHAHGFTHAPRAQAAHATGHGAL